MVFSPKPGHFGNAISLSFPTNLTLIVDVARRTAVTVGVAHATMV
jgi:hypothetical protein